MNIKMAIHIGALLLLGTSVHAVDLTWTEPADARVQGYYVYCELEDGSLPVPVRYDAGKKDVLFISDLEHAKVYDCWATSYGTNGAFESAHSNHLRVEVPLDAPSNFKLKVTIHIEMEH